MRFAATSLARDRPLRPQSNKRRGTSTDHGSVINHDVNDAPAVVFLQGQINRTTFFILGRLDFYDSRFQETLTRHSFRSILGTTITTTHHVLSYGHHKSAARIPCRGRCRRSIAPRPSHLGRRRHSCSRRSHPGHPGPHSLTACGIQQRRITGRWQVQTPDAAHQTRLSVGRLPSTSAAIDPSSQLRRSHGSQGLPLGIPSRA